MTMAASDSQRGQLWDRGNNVLWWTILY